MVTTRPTAITPMGRALISALIAAGQYGHSETSRFLFDVMCHLYDHYDDWIHCEHWTDKLIRMVHDGRREQVSHMFLADGFDPQRIDHLFACLLDRCNNDQENLLLPYQENSTLTTSTTALALIGAVQDGHHKKIRSLLQATGIDRKEIATMFKIIDIGKGLTPTPNAGLTSKNFVANGP